ncbi:alpha/beta hydrolase [Spirillospora sp. CA-255316]
MADYGMADEDILALRRLTDSGVPWMDAAERLAEVRMSAAADAARGGYALEAFRDFRHAAACFAFAQMAQNSDTARKAALYERIATAAQSAHRLSPTWFEFRAFPFDDGAVAAWLCVPADTPTVATVIVFGGQSGWGLSYARYADAFAARGIATVLLEGPGQGLTRLRYGVHLDAGFPEAVSRVIDHIDDDSRLTGPVGVVGSSMGGLFAAKSAAQDARIRGCVVNGAPARPRLLEFRTFREQAIAMQRVKEPGAVLESFSRLAFRAGADVLAVPLLVIHGGRDPIVSEGEQREFLAGATSRSQIRIWADGEHTVPNHHVERTRMVADWMTDALTHGEGSVTA